MFAADDAAIAATIRHTLETRLPNLPHIDEITRDIWCAKDSGKAWRSWMIDGTQPAPASAKCDMAALSRNVALGQKHAVTGTPSVVFEDSDACLVSRCARPTRALSGESVPRPGRAAGHAEPARGRPASFVIVLGNPRGFLIVPGLE